MFASSRTGRAMVAGLASMILLTSGGPDLTAHASRGDEVSEVSFRMNSEGHMVVPVRVNGFAAEDSIFDTGATFPLIDSRTADRSGIERPPEDAKRVFVLSLTGYNDHAVIQIDKLSVGTLQVSNLPAALSERSYVDGVDNVLPASAFPGDVVDIDFEEKVISYYSGRPKRLRDRVIGRTRLILRDGLYYINVRLNGKPALALVDTGSSVTYINSAYAREARASTHAEKTKILQGIAGVNPDASVANVRNLSMGGFRFRKLNVIVSDPQLFEHLGLADTPAMVIGTDVLSSFRVQIDRRREKLVLSPLNVSRPRSYSTPTISVRAR